MQRNECLVQSNKTLLTFLSDKCCLFLPICPFKGQLGLLKKQTKYPASKVTNKKIRQTSVLYNLSCYLADANRNC